MNRALSVGDLNPIPAICRPSELDVDRLWARCAPAEARAQRAPGETWRRLKSALWSGLSHSAPFAGGWC